MTTTRALARDEDPNVAELLESYDPGDRGTMLRLAMEIEQLEDFDLVDFPDLWSYFKGRCFCEGFVDRVARKYWMMAFEVVDGTPYRSVITDFSTSMEPVRRLMTYFLRKVCEVASKTSVVGGGEEETRLDGAAILRDLALATQKLLLGQGTESDAVVGQLVADAERLSCEAVRWLGQEESCQQPGDRPATVPGVATSAPGPSGSGSGGGR